MRAQKETKGHNPSAAVLELMDWTIFLTNIPATCAVFREILGIYGLRWRIEVIFKAWKSHLKFDHLHQVIVQFFRSILESMFMFVHLRFISLSRFIGRTDSFQQSDFPLRESRVNHQGAVGGSEPSAHKKTAGV